MKSVKLLNLTILLILMTSACAPGSSVNDYVSSLGDQTSSSVDEVNSTTGDNSTDVSATQQLATTTGPCSGVRSGKTIVVAKSNGNFTDIQKGLNGAQPGDIVIVKAGVYNGDINFPKSGSANKGCIILKGEQGAIVNGGSKGINIDNKNYVAIQNLTFQHQSGSDTPTGISVTGSSSHVEIRNNVVRSISNSNDAHGISFYGNANEPMKDLFVYGNEVKDCKLGSSESLVLNGNIDGFVVSHNIIHDNDNIGIDFIGFEGTGPAGKDQVRNGYCTDNLVYNISSAKNPAYKGELAADGIYVDGGKQIVIERNTVRSSDIGIEIASEHSGKITESITVRNNFVSGSAQGNVMIGGYDSQRGKARNISVLNNTLFNGKSGGLIIQYYSTNVTIKNNIFVNRSGIQYIVSKSSSNQAFVENNIYFGASSNSIGSFTDAHAQFVNPMLHNPPLDLHLEANSPAINSGIELGLDSNNFPLAGLLDIDGRSRIINGKIDIGAVEF